MKTQISFFFIAMAAPVSKAQQMRSLEWNVPGAVRQLTCLSNFASTAATASYPLDQSVTELRLTHAKSAGSHSFDDVIVSGNGGSGPDSNNNGIPDVWEIQNFGSLTEVTPATDVDHDAMTDSSEYLAVTDPKNSASVLTLSPSGTLPSHAGFVNQWRSASGRVYTIERTTELQSIFIAFASNISELPPLNGYTDGFATNAASIYRIKLQ
jgi:hypothetical protein